MKVLMIEHFMPSNQYTLELAKKLQDSVDLTFYCKKNAGNLDILHDYQKTMYEGGKNAVVAAVDYGMDLMHLRKELRKDYDVVHVQTFKRAQSEIPIYIKSKRQNQILVHTAHNILPHEAKKSDRALFSNFYEACDLLIVHNESSKNHLISEFNVPECKIKIIAHGIYGEMVPNTKEAGDKIHFLQFGTIRYYKGIDILLEAIVLLPDEIKRKCVFTIAGRQFQKLNSEDYEAMAKKLGIEDCVNFKIRRIEDEEIPALFAEADACLFPYREIYGSGALLMAYTYQKPVIASNVMTFVEETGNGSTGLLFKSESPQSLADAIEKYVNFKDIDRAGFIENIEMLVTKKYNWKASARKTVEAYQAAIDKEK